MKLKEAISPEAIDAGLKKIRKPVESKIKGDIGKYVISLEMLIDMFADDSPKSDAEFSSMMNRVNRNLSRMGPQGVAKKKGEKKPAQNAPQSSTTSTEPEDKPIPSLASLAASEPSVPPPMPSKTGLRAPKQKTADPKKEKEPMEPKGGMSYDDWMKTQQGSDADYEPSNLSKVGLPKIKDPKALANYKLDLAKSKEKRLKRINKGEEK